MSEEEVEQITKEPISEKKPVKVKDPKKVAAGKRLAEHNKRAKEALKEKMARDAENLEERESTSGESQSWIPQQMSFTTVLSVVGLGLTAFDMYMRYKRQQTPDREGEPPRAPLDNREGKPPREEECAVRVEQNSHKGGARGAGPLIGML